MCRQCSPAGATLRHALLPQLRVTLLCCDLNLGHCLLEIFECQLSLILRETLGFATELQTLELQQQVLKPFVLFQQCITFSRNRQHQRTQGIDICRQICQLIARVRHRANLRQRRSVCESSLSFEYVTNRARRTVRRTPPLTVSLCRP